MTFRLPSLAVDDGAVGVATSAREVAVSPAITLLVARASAGDPHFTLTDENASTIVEKIAFKVMASIRR